VGGIQNGPVRVAIVGMGGFAGFHRRALVSVAAEGRAIHVAQVAPPSDQEPFADELAELNQAGVAIHDSLRKLLAAERDQLDLLCIPTGIPLHRSMVIAACEAGVNVLVEKPAAGSIQDVDAMVAARDRSGVACTVGFQHLYQASTHRLKRWLVEGRFGQLQRIRGLGCWPRGHDYFSRNGWAGELATGDTWILDGPHNNALAHSVNLMGFLAGGTLETAAQPVTVTSELYRANPIHAADTVCLRTSTREQVDICFAVSHATEEESTPAFGLDTDQATLDLGFDGSLRVHWHDGREETEAAEAQQNERSVGGAIDWIAAGAPLDAQALASKPHCSLEVARTQTLIACGSYESSAIHDLPKALHREGPKGEIAIEGMTAAIDASFREGKLFSELGLDWAHAGDTVSMKNYGYFPTFRVPG
jgi:predicted dehydrogenase